MVKPKRASSALEFWLYVSRRTTDDGRDWKVGPETTSVTLRVLLPKSSMNGSNQKLCSLYRWHSAVVRSTRFFHVRHSSELICCVQGSDIANVRETRKNGRSDPSASKAT